MQVCVCVCVNTDASQGFSTYNKETQKAVNLVSAMAIPWPAPHPIATLLSTSPLTSMKVLSKAHRPLMRLPRYSRVVTTSLELATPTMSFSKFAPSSFSLTTILHCAVVSVCCAALCMLLCLFVYVSFIGFILFLGRIFYYFFFYTRPGKADDCLHSVHSYRLNATQLETKKSQHKSKFGNHSHQFDKI